MNRLLALIVVAVGIGCVPATTAKRTESNPSQTTKTVEREIHKQIPVPKRKTKPQPEKQANAPAKKPKKAKEDSTFVPKKGEKTTVVFKRGRDMFGTVVDINRSVVIFKPEGLALGKMRIKRTRIKEFQPFDDVRAKARVTFTDPPEVPEIFEEGQKKATKKRRKAPSKVLTISKGKAVNLKSHFVPNYYTLVEFYADW